MLSIEQFNVLVEIERGLESTAKKFLHMEEPAYNSVIESLESLAYISRSDAGKDEVVITDAGRMALEPYKVKGLSLWLRALAAEWYPLLIHCQNLWLW